eukprot:CAMPEP_0119008362 /NCGR_PEP_ID=MMETSP1176-20130426/3636_1 /TAXON_ID=265551 /ORGANISM="Synedropsis recta cf, Strain CCMP1620" /LENGTH=459 /DNA_ID=CAMNT_0006960677 /DNA_START=78 /DNA_END=1457 /DNA_ORIENTATION=-
MGSTLSLAATYCFCTSAGSLCNSCLGSTAAGTTGRKRAVLLLTLAISIALWFQYSVGPGIVQETGWVWKTYRAIPGSGKLVFSAWKKGCDQYEGDLLSQCAGQAGVYRSMFLATLFFILSAAATHVQPQLNREAWPAKYAIFCFAILITMFVPNTPLFSGFFLWFSRFGASVFVVLQQVILIDVAYNWNDDWVEKSNEADRISYGSGGGWLKAIVGTCVLLYSCAIVGISILYHFFDGCPENTWVITLTLLGIIAMTGIQVAGQDGSLLTSSVMALYATYLCYSVVSKNPNGSCNPQLGQNDVWGIVIGLTLTAVSLAWTGFSWSAEHRLTVDAVQSTKSMTPATSNPNPDGINLDVPFLDAEQQPATGLVMEQSEGGASCGGTDIWKLNAVMALVCCWVAMILTGWGTLEDLNESHNAANPTAGRVNMAMIGVSQWIAIGLYSWTLLAPRLFPDRDFS